MDTQVLNSRQRESAGAPGSSVVPTLGRPSPAIPSARVRARRACRRDRATRPLVPFGARCRGIEVAPRPDGRDIAARLDSTPRYPVSKDRLSRPAQQTGSTAGLDAKSQRQTSTPDLNARSQRQISTADLNGTTRRRNSTARRSRTTERHDTTRQTTRTLRCLARETSTPHRGSARCRRAKFSCVVSRRGVRDEGRGCATTTTWPAELPRASCPRRERPSAGRDAPRRNRCRAAGERTTSRRRPNATSRSSSVPA